MDDMKEYTIKDFIDIIYSNRNILSRTIVAVVSFSIVYVLVVSPLFISKSKILTNSGSVNSIGKISSLASQFGVSLGGQNQQSMGSFSPEVYLEILNSRILFDKLCELSFNIKNNDSNDSRVISLLEYLNQKEDQQEDPAILKEYAFKKFYNDKIIVSSKNIDSSSITIEISTTNKDLSFQLLQATINVLNDIQLNFKTEKIRVKKIFINDRVKETLLTLEKLEDDLLLVEKSNISYLSSPSLSLKKEKLEREVYIVKNIYMNLKNEFEMAKIELVEESTSIDIIDPPNYPALKDWPKRKLIVIQAFLFSIVLGIIFIFINQYYLMSARESKDNF